MLEYLIYYRSRVTVAIFSLFLDSCSTPREKYDYARYQKIGCIINTPPQHIWDQLASLQLEAERLYADATNIDATVSHKLMSTLSSLELETQKLQREVDFLWSGGRIDNVWVTNLSSTEKTILLAMGEMISYQPQRDSILQANNSLNIDENGEKIWKSIHDFDTGEEMIVYMDAKMTESDSMAFADALKEIQQRVPSKGEFQVAQVIETVAQATYQHDVARMTEDSLIISDRIFPTGFVLNTGVADCSGFASESFRVLKELGYDVLRLNVHSQGMKQTHGLIAVNIDEIVLDKLGTNRKIAIGFKRKGNTYIIIEPQSKVYQPMSPTTRYEKYKNEGMRLLGTNRNSGKDVTIRTREVEY